MKTAIVLAFIAGFYLAKLDSKYGYEAGQRAGTWTRHFLGLKPLTRP